MQTFGNKFSKKQEIDGYFMDNHWYELDIEKLFKWIVTKNLRFFSNNIHEVNEFD